MVQLPLETKFKEITLLDNTNANSVKLLNHFSLLRVAIKFVSTYQALVSTWIRRLYVTHILIVICKITGHAYVIYKWALDVDISR